MVPPPIEMPGDSDDDPELCMTRHPDLNDFALTSNPNNPIT
jgi:hypothetical protein